MTMYRRPDGSYPGTVSEIVDALGLSLNEDGSSEGIWEPGDDLPAGWSVIEWGDVKDEHPTLAEYGTPMFPHEEEIWKRCPRDENGDPIAGFYWNWAVGCWEK